ncbi:MFS transporter [Catellatospora coxensis]|uniref:MFS transporter n=1 Tax=Catellatospora coxensis TaxID=310354 RepID=A0A8J3LAB5_9ACTN|nr:MFS transporter [Catellatospora coxensis]GIG09120.1 MFS transporter [Catellatospora coxensis]
MTSKRRFALDLTPLRRRDFRLVYTAAGVSSFGSMITYVTIPFQLKQMTGDPLTVGLLGVVELVPLLFMAFVGGALADYVDRRKLVFWAEAGLAVLTGLLLLNALVGSPQVWVLFVIAGLAAAVDGIHRPAMDAMMPRLAPAEEMASVGALNSLRWQVAQIAGPTLAGIMIANWDVAWVFGFDLATFAVSLICFGLVRAVAPPEAAERPSLRSVVEGVRYARSRPELIGTYLVDINAMFFAFPVALYPWVADKYGGASVLGLFYAALATGSLLVTVTSGWTARVHRHGLAVLVAAGAWGLGIVLFGLAGSLWLALLGLVVAGASDMISGLFRGVIWNQTIPDHLRGRLAGIEMLSYLTGPMLGQTRAGLSARWWGYSGAVVWGGVLCVAGTGALAAALPAFLRYDGREGLARKQAEEAARAAELAAVRPVEAPSPA